MGFDGKWMASSVQAAAVNFPPGFRFRPSDEEIVGFYLKNKVHGNKFEFDVIREIDLYKCEPWDLPEKSFLPSRDLEWYFFCPRDRKYPNGSRSNRATEAGYWKATGKDRKVSSRSNNHKIGTKKTLVFYKGRAPNGERTDWLMHEYRLEGTQCKGGTNLQDLYVLSRVFKKPKQGSNDQETFQEAFPMLNNTSSPADGSDGDIEGQSEDRSSPGKPEDDAPASSRSETSSEILDNKTEDINCIDGPMECLQDISNPNYNSVSLRDTSTNENDDSQWRNQKLQNDSFYSSYEEECFPHILESPYLVNNDYSLGTQMNSSVMESEAFERYLDFGSFSDQDSIDLASMLNSFECDDLYSVLPISEEEKNDEACVAGFLTSMPDNGVQIQFRSRPQLPHSNQQPLPSQGTAMRRLRLQIYKSEESANGRKEHPLTVNGRSASSDCNSDDSDESEVITQPEDSPLASFPSQISCCSVEDDAESDTIHDSVESSEIVANGHDFNLEPTQFLPSSFFPVEEASEKSDMSVNSKESGDKSVLIERTESVMSSACSQSSSTEIQIETTVSHTTGSQEIDSVSVKSSALGMESPTVLASKKALVSEGASSFGSRQLGAISSNHNGVAETQGLGKFTGFNVILTGLNLRGKFREKYVSSDHVEESRNVTENVSDLCSKDSSKGFSSLRKALGIFIQPFRLQSKMSKGANCIPLICLLSTVFLVVCIWNTYLSARSSSPIIL